MRKTVKSMVDEATAAITTYSIEEARDLHGRDDVQFIDIRDVRELERDGVIPGAFHAPRGMLEFWVDPESPYHKPVFGQDKRFVLFCAAGWRSALATKTLQDMGLEKVAHIDGGFTAWKAAGAPVATKGPKADKAANAGPPAGADKPAG
jgi:rhodanese-related sulfurtransferase